MKASAAFCLSAALLTTALVSLPTQAPVAQKSPEKEDAEDLKVEWGEALTLSNGQVVSIKSEIKSNVKYGYSITTKGSASVKVGDTGAFSEAANALKLVLTMSEVQDDTLAPDEDKEVEVAAEYFSLQVDRNDNGKEWSFISRKANGENSPAIGKLFVQGKETNASQDHGYPNPGSVRSNLNNKVAYARAAKNGGLKQLSHGISWGSVPRDVPQGMVDPLAFMRFLFPGIGSRDLEIAVSDGKPSASFEIRGVELPVEVAKGTTALYDLSFELVSARGIKAKDLVKSDDGTETKDEEAEDEIRLLTFNFEAKPQAGLSVDIGGGKMLTPGAYTGTLSLDPRMGVVGHLSISGSAKGEGMESKIQINASLLERSDD